MAELPIHSIQIAAARSGLSPHVVRIWERRYAAVTPSRDASARRLYSEREIERLALLRKATEAGHSISTIARLSSKQLEKLVADIHVAEPPTLSRSAQANRLFQHEALDAVRRLDSAALDEAFQRGLMALGQQGLLQTGIAPLAEQVGESWRAGELTAAHEHFFTAATKVFLGHLTKQFAPASKSPSLVSCTPAGQFHELGAYMAGVVAANLGWRVAYLGAALPAPEIAGAALQHEAAVVALSIIYPEDDPKLEDELTSLRRYLPPSTRLIVGGRAAAAQTDLLARIGAIVVNSLTDFGKALDRVRQTARRQSKNV